jgi:hypothetical protein
MRSTSSGYSNWNIMPQHAGLRRGIRNRTRAGNPCHKPHINLDASLAPQSHRADSDNHDEPSRPVVLLFSPSPVAAVITHDERCIAVLALTHTLSNEAEIMGETDSHEKTVPYYKNRRGVCVSPLFFLSVVWSETQSAWYVGH